MLAQAGGRREPLLTGLALVRLDASVGATVLEVAPLAGEGLATAEAGVGLLAAVFAHVNSGGL